MLYQISILNKLVEFTGKHLYQSLFLKKALSLKLHLKKDSGAGAFRWILWIFSEHLFYSTRAIGRVVLEAAIPLSFLWVLHNSKITFHIENISRQPSAWFIYDKTTSSWYQAHFKKVVPKNFIKSLVTGWKCDLWLLSRNLVRLSGSAFIQSTASIKPPKEELINSNSLWVTPISLEMLSFPNFIVHLIHHPLHTYS